MPKGIPVATFAIGTAGAANAALFAVAMLARDNPGLLEKLLSLLGVARSTRSLAARVQNQQRPVRIERHCFVAAGSTAQPRCCLCAPLLGCGAVAQSQGNAGLQQCPFDPADQIVGSDCARRSAASGQQLVEYPGRTGCITNQQERSCLSLAYTLAPVTVGQRFKETCCLCKPGAGSVESLAVQRNQRAIVERLTQFIALAAALEER